MGLFDIASNVLLDFKVDTKQAKRELRKLTGEQKKAAKATIEAAEAQNEALEITITKLGKVDAAIGTAVAAFRVLTNAANAYAKRAQQIDASGSADFRRIAKATSNLVTETQALELAARTAGGTFKTSAQEMDLAAKAAVILSQKQGTLEQALDKVGQALSEGNVEPLKEYGIILDAQSDTIEGYNAVVDAMNTLLRENSDFAQRAGTATQRAGVQWKDAIDNLVVSLGELANALAPIIRQTAQLIGQFAILVSTDRTADTARQNAAFQRRRMRNRIGIERRRAREARNERIDSLILSNQLNVATDGRFGAALRSATGFVGGQVRGLVPESLRDGRPSRRRGDGGGAFSIGTRLPGTDADEFIPAGAIQPGLLPISAAAADPAGFEGALGENNLAALNNLTRGADAARRALAGVRSESAKLGEVVGQLGANLGSLFEQVGAGTLGAFEALKIAARKTIGDELRALAAKEFAKAAAAAKTLNLGMAALHVAAGVGLRTAAGAIEGGGGGGTSAAIPGAARGAIGTPGGLRQRSEVIVVAPSPFDDDQRGARNRLRDMVDRAGNITGSGTEIVRA